MTWRPLGNIACALRPVAATDVAEPAKSCPSDRSGYSVRHSPNFSRGTGQRFSSVADLESRLESKPTKKEGTAMKKKNKLPYGDNIDRFRLKVGGYIPEAMKPPIRSLYKYLYPAQSPKSAKEEFPDFYADGMKLWDKNLASLNDPRFRHAYKSGVAGGAHIEFRAYVCCWAASQAIMIPGDFVECGVNEGLLSLTVCHYLDFNSLDKSFYLFDTYQGIPTDQITARERRRAMQHEYSECYERTKEKFASFPKATLVRGKVPETLQTVQIDKVSYLSIDMNIAKPERDAIDFFWPKLSPGGFVILDDYAFAGYEAQHEIMDDFAAKVGTHILTLPTGQGMLIKN
jgi:hypothetical protein